VAVETEIVGPIPESQDPGEYDKRRRRVLWKMPSGLYVVTSRAGDRRNGMTANWTTQVSFRPKLLAVSVEQSAYTHQLISEGSVFTINVIAREDRTLVRKFTKPVDVDPEARTLNGVPYHDGATGPPILDQAFAYLECELRDNFGVGDHTLFIGEVVGAGFQADEDAGVLRMEDTKMNYGG
jgi:flavin reductase (DIM6/NTAB) family NADH-FMN oxidoreductase RutF